MKEGIEEEIESNMSISCSYFEDCRALYIEEQRAEACNIFPAGEMEAAREIILHPNMNFPSKKVA